MALLWLVWLLSVTVLFAQSQPPGGRLPHPHIHLKLGSGRQIISSTKGRKNWNELYTHHAVDDSVEAAEPVTASEIAVFSVNGTSLPPYDTVVSGRPLFSLTTRAAVRDGL